MFAFSLIRSKISAWLKKKPAATYEQPTPGDERLPEAVFKAELASISARRAAYGMPPSDPATLRENLMGMAISGGGIRSAVFSLGVVQGLARHQLFQKMDYLSTVSGGGYLGSALSSLYATAPRPEDLVIYLRGVTYGARLSAGTRVLDGRWRLSYSELQDLTLDLPAYGEIDLLLEGEVACADASTDLCLDQLKVVIRLSGEGDLDCSAEGASLRVVRGANACTNSVALHIHTELSAFTHAEGLTEGRAFQHLRNHSNYLVPSTLFSGVRMPALFLRGVLINLLIILPMVVLAALITLWVSSGSLREAMDTEDITVSLADIHSPWVMKRPDGDGYYLDLATGVQAQAVGDSDIPDDHVAVVEIPHGVEVGDKTRRDVYGLVANVQETLTIPVHVTRAAERPVELKLRLWNEAGDSVTPDYMDPVTSLHERAMRWVRAGVLGFAILLACYPVVEWLSRCGDQRSWGTRDKATRYAAGGALAVLAIVTAILLQPLAIYYFHILSEAHAFSLGDGGETLTVLWSVITGVSVLLSGSLAERAGSALRKPLLIAIGLMGPILIWLLYLNICRWALVPETAPDWLILASQALASKTDGPLGTIRSFIDATGYRLGDIFRFADDGSFWLPHSEATTMVYGAAGLLVMVGTHLFYDINATSFHGFYRDRLSKAFLFDVWTKNGIRHNDGQRLSELSDERGPYHLINTTLNVRKTKQANVRGRKGSHFIFSKHFVGGHLIGYRRTSEIEQIHPNLDLGAAMAISGAAAAPNMGSYTVNGLTFIMTMLNVRLGYWLPHPSLFTNAVFLVPGLGPFLASVVKMVLRVTPLHLLREMFGALHERGRHVNLTDGGHLENTGLFELLRRRCRVIILSDAEADPQFAFKGLADAVRMARIDLGISIDIDVSPIRANNGISDAHAVIGRIDYGNGDCGYLLYIKSSLTGDENVYIQKYRALEPTFPHQSTADQFFDEEQFEAYRSLGYHAADGLFRRHIKVDPLRPTRDDLLSKLAKLHGVQLK